METPTQTLKKSRGNKRTLLLVFGIFAIAVMALLGGWVYQWHTGHNTEGLEGTWYAENDPKHPFEFRSNGQLDMWYGSKSWWNRIGWEATWRRDGQKITIRTDKNWDFIGTLDGDTIRGKMIFPDGDPTAEDLPDTVWQRR